MHLLRTAPLITLTLACLAVPATTAAAAALPHHAQAATVDRIVIYKGEAKGDAGPPAGSLSATKWKTDAAPGNIYTNDGTLVVDTALEYSGVTQGGFWWYKVSPNTVILHSFYWEKNGTKTEEHNLQNIANNNNAWFTLAGGATVSPRCLQFSPSPGTVLTFQLSKENGNWVKDASGCTTAVP